MKVVTWHPCPNCHPGPAWDADENYELHCLACGEHCDLCHCEKRPCDACQAKINAAPNEIKNGAPAIP